MNFPVILRRFAPVAALVALPLFANSQAAVYAQSAPPPAPPAPEANRRERVEERSVIVQNGGEGGASSFVFSGTGDHDFLLSTAAGNTLNFVSSEMSFDRRTVKGAPYTAEAVTETVQTLPDGNRIVRRTSAQVARDGEGRTRREQTLNFVGNFAALNAAATAPRSIFINDPVAGVNYVLNEKDRTARKLPSFNFDFHIARNVNGAVTHSVNRALERSLAPLAAVGRREPLVIIKETKDGVTTTKEYRGKEAEDYLARERGASASPLNERRPNVTTEKLDKQVIEGVEAEGTRTTTTIPANAIGNERPIIVTSERWYSPELQTVVMTRRNDPRTGETTYKLTNINRGEPARTLFEVPGDYTIKASPTPPMPPARPRRPRMEREER